jgi:hypothetical protein
LEQTARTDNGNSKKETARTIRFMAPPGSLDFVSCSATLTATHMM